MSDVHVWGRSDVGACWPRPRAQDDKYSRGVVGVIAGSEAYPGAAVLVASGAVRSGAGMVRYVGPRRAQDLVLTHRPECVVHEPVDATGALPRAQAWVVGPGVADSPAQEAAIGAVMEAGLPMVVDAGALENVAKARAAGARETPSDRVLMTPHIEELMRTLDALRHDVTWADVVQDRAGHARLLAEKTRATVLLKGSQTVIASPGGSLVELPPAVAWLATAGSGDVLAGIAGTLLAAGLTASDAGASAAWVHAEAGKRASGASTGPGGPLAALDIASYVPVVIAELLSF